MTVVMVMMVVMMMMLLSSKRLHEIPHAGEQEYLLSEDP